jgi:7-cyano-7-deazaguanine reductase
MMKTIRKSSQSVPITSLGYSEEHAQSGLKTPLPLLETFSNQYPSYEIMMEIPEFTSVCPKTGLPDFGKLTIKYVPDKLCVELKSLKMYILAYRHLGIFNENVVNRVLDDFVSAVRPVSCEVSGQFSARGGIHSTVTARYPRRA